MLPCPQCKPGEYQAAMACQGPSAPTEEELDEAVDRVLKALNVQDPVIGGMPVVLAATKINPEDHLLDMSDMDMKWFKARDDLRKAIREMLWANECSWW